MEEIIGRGYPDWYNGPFDGATLIPAPCALFSDVWLQSQLSLGNPPWNVILGSFTNDRQTGKATFPVGLTYTSEGQPLILQHGDEKYLCLQPFSSEKWYNVELRIEPDGRVLVYQDGVLNIDPNNTLRIPPEANIGTIGGHAGLYQISPDQEHDFPQGTFLLNDNFRVVRWGILTETPIPTATPTGTPTPTPTPI